MEWRNPRDVRFSPNSGVKADMAEDPSWGHLRTSNNKKSGHTYDIGRIRNSKPYCSNIALAVIERRYTR